MNYPSFFEAKKSLNLFGHRQHFTFLTKLYNQKKLPKVMMFTGNKGLGKSTLINHFLFSIFDTKNYNFKDFSILDSSTIFKQFNNDIFANIVYFNGRNFKTIKVEEIKDLKKKIFQSSILNKERFIIFDDIELFNNNCLNALLKIIEEPGKNNYFFLINNKSKPLLETVRSRSIELKIILNRSSQSQIINDLTKFFKLKTILDLNETSLTPGNFIKFDYILQENNISLDQDLIPNLSNLLNLYKKNKDIIFMNLAFFIVNYYFKDISSKSNLNIDNINDIKNFIFKSLNNFLIYNINHNTVINAVNNKLNHE